MSKPPPQLKIVSKRAPNSVEGSWAPPGLPGLPGLLARLSPNIFLFEPLLLLHSSLYFFFALLWKFIFLLFWGGNSQIILEGQGIFLALMAPPLCAIDFGPVRVQNLIQNRNVFSNPDFGNPWEINLSPREIHWDP